MTETQWLSSDDPHGMLRWITCAGPSGSGEADVERWARRPSDHKLRRFAAACCWVVSADMGRDAEELIASCSGRARASTGWAMAWAGDQDLPTKAARADLLRDVIGNPFRPFGAFVTQPNRWICCGCRAVVFMRPREGIHACECGTWSWRQTTELDDWLTADALSLARAAYDASSCNRIDPDRLAVVADALEDGGCDCKPLLRHLRSEEPCPGCSYGQTPYYSGGGGWCAFCDTATADITYLKRVDLPHVRGCWALDLILGEGGRG